MTRLPYISVCRRTRQDTISYSFIYIVQKLGTVELRKLWNSETMDRDRGTPKTGDRGTSETVELRNYGPGPWNSETVACYSPLLVLVCWSVSQDPPPRPIEGINFASAFLYSPSTALSQSAVAYVHVGPGRPISDRL